MKTSSSNKPTIVAICLAAWLGALPSRAAVFEVGNIPAYVLNNAAASNFWVSFAPTVQGVVTTALHLANNSGASPYVVNLRGYGWTATNTLSQVYGPAAGGNTVILTNVPFGCGGADITNVMVGATAAAITGQGANWVAITMPAGSAGTTVNILVQSACQGDTPMSQVYTYRPAGVITGGGGGARWVDYRIDFSGGTSVDPAEGVRYPTNTAADGRSRWTYYYLTDVGGGAIRLMDTNGVLQDPHVAAVGYGSDFGTDGIRYPSYDWIAQNPATNFIYDLNGGSNHYVVVTNLPGSSYQVDFLGSYYGGGSSWKFNAKLLSGRWAADSDLQGGSFGTNASATWQNPGGGGNNADATNAAWFGDRYVTWSNVVPSNTAFTIVQWNGTGGAYNNYTFLNCMRIRGFEPSTGPGAGVYPSSGPYTGGVFVTITGSNLCDGTGADVSWVTLCGVTAAVQAVNGQTQIVVQAGYGGYGLGHVVVYSTEYGATTRSNAFTYLSAPSPIMTVLGINGGVIENGASAAQIYGTHFGNRQFERSYTNTFTIINGSDLILTNWAWVTNGTGAAAFQVVGMPATVAAGGTSTFKVVFTPAAAEAYACSVVVTNNSLYNNPFTLNLAGQGVLFEQTLAFDNPGDQFVTNKVGLAATASSGLPVAFFVTAGDGDITGGTNLTFESPGTVTITALQTGDTSYASAYTSQTFSVNQAQAEITVGGLNAIYDGTPKAVTVTTVPAALRVVTNYLSSAGPPVNAGEYYVSVEVQDLVYVGYVVRTQVIELAMQAITDFVPTNGSVFLTTNVASLSASTTAGLPVSFTNLSGPALLDGSTLTFTGTGIVEVAARQSGDSNYVVAASLTNLYIIQRAQQAPLFFLPASPQTVFTTNALALTGGSGTGVTSFAVLSGPGAIVDDAYLAINSGTGSVLVTAGKAGDDMYDAAMVTAEVVCAKAAQTIVTNNIPYSGNDEDPVVVLVTNRYGLFGEASSGLPVYFTLVNGPAQLSDGTNLSFTTAGRVEMRCSQDGDDNFRSVSILRIFTVRQLDATVTLQGLAQFFDGNPKPVSATTVPEGLQVAFTYNEDTNAPAAVGSYGVTATTDDPVYLGSATGILVISYMPMMEVQTLAGTALPNGLPSSYALGTDFGTIATNASKAVTLVFTNSGLADVAVSGIGTDAVGLAYFTVSNFPATVTAGSASNFTVNYAPADLGAHAFSLSVTNNGTNTPYVINFAGTGVKPGEIGLIGSSLDFVGRFSGPVVGHAEFTITNTGSLGFGYTNEILYGEVADWLTISAPTGALDGEAFQSHTGRVDITGLNAGAYRATNWIVSAEAVNSPVPMLARLLVLKGTQTIAFASIDNKVTTNVVGLAATAASGLPVSFRVVNSPASITGGTNLAFTGAGDVAVVASQAGNSNWLEAAEVTNVFSVSKADAGVYLSGLSYIYDGAAKSASVTTDPAGLATKLTYTFPYEAGPSDLPTYAGEYPVNATVQDAIYQGTATGTLVIARADQGITFPVIPDQFITNLVVLQATASSGLPITFTNLTANAVIADGTNLTFTDQGPCRIVALQAGDTNWNEAASVTNVFTVNKADATVYLSKLEQTYDDTPRSVLVAVDPHGLAYDVIYDGDTNVPVNAGSYAVDASVDDLTYQGRATGVLDVARAGQTLSFANPGNQAATNKLVLSATASSSLPANFAVVSGPAVITGSVYLAFTNLGEVALVAAQPGNTNWAGVTNAPVYFNVVNAAATVTLSATNQTYTGTGCVVTVTTDPPGLAVLTTYNGDTNGPINAGTYAVTSTVTEALYEGTAIGVLTIAQASQAITFPAITPKARSASVGLAATASSALAVTFGVGSGPGSIAGATNLTFSGVGDVAVVASQAGNGNYLAAPDMTNLIKVYQLSTNVGPYAGGILVTLTNGALGDGTDITNITVGGVAAAPVAQGANWVSFAVPAVGSAGLKDVGVQSTSLGQALLGGAYTVNAGGAILGLAPSNGLAVGGFTVTITGTNLCAGDVTNVTLCGVAATGTVVQLATQVVVYAGVTAFGRSNGEVRVCSVSFGETILSNAFSYEGPSSISLAGFHMEDVAGQVQVCWQTESESETLGFDLYREDAGAWVKVNAAMIPAQGWPLGGEGASYCVADPGATLDGTYRYKLVEYETTGELKEYGPFERSLWAPRFSNVQAAPVGVVIQWNSRDLEVYDVMKSLDARAAYAPAAAGLPATPPVNSWTDQTESAGAAFYRIEAR